MSAGAKVESPMLQVRLLGAFSLDEGDASLPAITSARLQALLTYLALHRDAPQPRHHLAALFWPDVPEAQARNNLRQLLHQLRHALPEADHIVSIDMQTVRWRDDAPCSLDAADFERALAQADLSSHQGDRHTQREALAVAVDLYRADLLPSCYDDWIVPERERLRQSFLRALAELVHLLEVQRDYGLAIRHAQS